MLPTDHCYSHDVAGIRANDFLNDIVGMNRHRKTCFFDDNGYFVNVILWSQQYVGFYVILLGTGRLAGSQD
jgi:hypothetical protein